MGTQLREWEGGFGDAYTDRNAIDWEARRPLLREMLGSLPIRAALEVGCNRGHNLKALLPLLGEKAKLVGVEPNAHARTLAKSSLPQMEILAGTIDHLPFKPDSFDLAMTWGVLIHVPLAGLAPALDEVLRVTRRYILAVEYFAETETTIHYRGRDDLLWKRDFLRHFQERAPGLVLRRSGFWGKDQGADDVTWWLLEKRPVISSPPGAAGH